MAQTQLLPTISVRVDNDTKKQFEEFCESMGMNMAVATSMLIKAVLRGEQQIPFQTRLPKPTEDYNSDVLVALQQSWKHLSYSGNSMTDDEIFEAIAECQAQ
jgi:DNA-damage-inducible protein J